MDTSPALRSPAAILRFAGTAAVGLTLDLATKILAAKRLKYQAGIEFIPGWLHLDYTENHGAVFGIGEGHQWLFIGVSVIAIAFLIGLFLRSSKQWFYQIILGMLLAGVIGNMIDRVTLGYVRDMIHALPGWRWPGEWQLGIRSNQPGEWRIGPYPGPGRDVFPYIFNVADSLLCVGVFLMMVYSFLSTPEKNKEPTTDEKPVNQS